MNRATLAVRAVCAALAVSSGCNDGLGEVIRVTNSAGHLVGAELRVSYDLHGLQTLNDERLQRRGVMHCPGCVSDSLGNLPVNLEVGQPDLHPELANLFALVEPGQSGAREVAAGGSDSGTNDARGGGDDGEDGGLSHREVIEAMAVGFGIAMAGFICGAGVVMLITRAGSVNGHWRSN